MSDSAFPFSETNECFQYPNTQHHGLTKRELFAAMAMQGILSENENVYSQPQVAADSVSYADALIAELGKEKP